MTRLPQTTSEKVRKGAVAVTQADDRERSTALVLGTFARCRQLCRFLDAGNNEGLGTLS